MFEQLDIFSFIDDESKKEFNVVEEYAFRGSGFVDGKKRIRKFFESCNDSNDRAEFLKKEYGIGGFGMPCTEPFVLCSGMSNASGNVAEYYNENMERIIKNISYSLLAETIDLMIRENRY